MDFQTPKFGNPAPSGSQQKLKSNRAFLAGVFVLLVVGVVGAWIALRPAPNTGGKTPGGETGVVPPPQPQNEVPKETFVTDASVSALPSNIVDWFSDDTDPWRIFVVTYDQTGGFRMERATSVTPEAAVSAWETKLKSESGVNKTQDGDKTMLTFQKVTMHVIVTVTKTATGSSELVQIY